VWLSYLIQDLVPTAGRRGLVRTLALAVCIAAIAAPVAFAKGRIAVTLGDSSAVGVGDGVVAIGDPFGRNIRPERDRPRCSPARVESRRPPRDRGCRTVGARFRP